MFYSFVAAQTPTAAELSVSELMAHAYSTDWSVFLMWPDVKVERASLHILNGSSLKKCCCCTHCRCRLSASILYRTGLCMWLLCYFTTGPLKFTAWKHQSHEHEKMWSRILKIRHPVFEKLTPSSKKLWCEKERSTFNNKKVLSCKTLAAAFCQDRNAACVFYCI